MDSNMIIYQENQILLTVGPSRSTSVSMIKHAGITSTSIFLKGLFIQYLQKGVNTILSLQPYLPISLQDNSLYHLYRVISAVISLQLSLLTYLRSGFLQMSLLISLRNEFLQSSLPASLRSKLLQSYLLASLWNVFLQRLYKDIHTVISIPSKPEIFLQGI